MGDLNFRIDELAREEVLTRIEKKEYDYLLKYDQVSTFLGDKFFSFFIHRQVISTKKKQKRRASQWKWVLGPTQSIPLKISYAYSRISFQNNLQNLL